MLLHFSKERVQTLLNFTKAATAWRMLWERPETNKAGLWLVGDQGVYLMDNAKPGLLADGVSVRDANAPQNASSYVSYAREVDPERLAFDEWWYNKRASFGGDDGSDFVSAEDATEWIAGTAGAWLVMDINKSSFLLIKDSAKEDRAPKDAAKEYTEGFKAGMCDCGAKLPAKFARGDIDLDSEESKSFKMGYVGGYKDQELKCQKPKTLKSKSAKRGTART